MLFLESNSLLPLNFLSCFESRSERAHASVRSDVSTRLPPAVWLHPAASVNLTQPLGEKFALQSTYEYIKVLAKLRAWHHFVIGEWDIVAFFSALVTDVPKLDYLPFFRLSTVADDSAERNQPRVDGCILTQKYRMYFSLDKYFDEHRNFAVSSPRVARAINWHIWIIVHALFSPLNLLLIANGQLKEGECGNANGLLRGNSTDKEYLFCTASCHRVHVYNPMDSLFCGGLLSLHWPTQAFEALWISVKGSFGAKENPTQAGFLWESCINGTAAATQRAAFDWWARRIFDVLSSIGRLRRCFVSGLAWGGGGEISVFGASSFSFLP